MLQLKFSGQLSAAYLNACGGRHGTHLVVAEREKIDVELGHWQEREISVQVFSVSVDKENPSLSDFQEVAGGTVYEVYKVQRLPRNLMEMNIVDRWDIVDAAMVKNKVDLESIPA